MLHKETVIKNNYSDINPVIYGTEECEKNHAYGPNIRTYWLLHYVRSGCGEFTVDGSTYKINEGEIFVIPPFKETFYKADSVNPWTYTWIGFTSGIELPEAFSHPVIKSKHSEKFFNKLKKCEIMQNGKTPFLCACIWEFISALYEKEKLHTNYAQMAQSIIESEYMMELNISDIADRLNINRSYLFNVFKAETGVSPQQYLINIRLDKAAELMTEHGETISVSALSVGYTDIYNFSKVFKKHFGMSPRKYINEYKKNIS